MALEDGRYEILFSMVLGHTLNLREKNVNYVAHRVFLKAY
jgi:hypothetical protein